MHDDELVFLTGATGFVGTQLVQHMLRSRPGLRLALLIRPGKGKSAEDRASSIIPSSERARVRVYSGDVTLPNCGLDAATYLSLLSEATHIVHSAATVRFDHSLDEARRMNVGGTRNLLDLAASMQRLRSFDYVGTAYVAGQRTGVIQEDELDVGQGYRNTYEQSKAEAEALVRSRLGSLPAMILRPSIIVGDSQTGVTSSFKMMYWPLKIYSRGLWRTVPGYPDAILDVVPVDFVTAAVAHLAFDANAIGGTFHLCAGPRASATINQVARRAAEYFNGREPRYIDPRIFFGAIRPLLFLTLWGRKRRVLVDGRAYRDYFSMRMQFDTTNADRLLAPAGICPPPVLDYLDRLFHYCIASEWGRKAIPAQ